MTNSTLSAHGSGNLQANNRGSIIQTTVNEAPPSEILGTPPAPPSSFVGRDESIGEISSILSSSVVVLQGMGGIGKTALAKKVAFHLNDTFSNNVFWGDMDRTNGNALPIFRAWGRLCGETLRNVNSIESVSIVRGWLTSRLEKNKSLLVIIDDLRQEWLEEGKHLLDAIPEGASVLITTRDAKIVQITGAKKYTIDVLSESEAYDFLAKRSEETLSEGNAVEIAKLTGRVPLALELAAQVAKEDGVSYLLDEMQNAAGRLSALEFDDAVYKDESVRISFDISYNALTEKTQKVFRYLGAFSPSSIHHKHFGVLFETNEDQLNINKELMRLKKRSLLALQNKNGIYRLHTLLYDYAQILLIGDENIDARQKHFEFYRDLTYEYEKAINSGEKGISQTFYFFYPQLEQAFENYEKVYGRPALGADIANFSRHLGRLSSIYGERLEQALNWMDRCQNALKNKDDEDANAIRALMHIHRASIYFQLSKLDAVESNCHQGIGLVDEENHPEILAEGYKLLGVTQGRRGELDLALDTLNTSLKFWEQVNPPNEYQYQRTENNIRAALYHLGDLSKLKDAEEKSLKFWSQYPNRKEFALALTNCGLVHEQFGENGIAITLLLQAIELSDRLGVPRIQAMARLNIAGPYNSLGKYDVSQRYLEECLKYDKGEFEIDAKRMLAEIEIEQNNIKKAVALANEAFVLAKGNFEQEDPLEEGAALRTLGRAYHLQGNLELAKKNLKRSQKLLKKNKFKYEEYLTVKELKKLYSDMNEEEKLKTTEEQIEKLKKETGLGAE